MNAYLDQFRRVLESRGLIAPAEIIADGKSTAATPKASMGATMAPICCTLTASPPVACRTTATGWAGKTGVPTLAAD